MKTVYTLLIAILSGFCISAQTYNSTTFFNGLQYPVAFDVAPDGRFFITEKGDGSNTPAQRSRILVYSNSGALLGTFYDLSDSTISTAEKGVLGIALDPDFITNHHVYVYYNHFYNNDERIRIIRFTETSNIGTNPTLIFDLPALDKIYGHVGGNIRFRPSQPDKLYFTIGDILHQQTNPTLNYANKITNPFGKVLRINKDGTIPTDNPFYDDGNALTANCDWIWSYGHRNPFDFCFSTVNDSLYCSENGLYNWDEVNLISKGHFYGWAECEGDYMNSSVTILCNAPNATAPITTFSAPLPAVTGILFYSGTAWSALNNHLLVADYNNGNIYDCTLGNAPSYNIVTNKILMGDMTTSGGLTTLKQSADGCIYAMNGGYTTNGGIFKICPTFAAIHENPSSLLSLSVYPNPAKNNITIETELSVEKTIRIDLRDIYGRNLQTESITMNPGKATHTLRLDNNIITKGIYFIQVSDLSSKQLLSSRKIVIE